MKIKLTTTIFFLGLSAITLAQKPDKTIARITYNFTHVRDTLKRDQPYTEKMILITGKNASVYTSLDRIGRDLDLPKAIPAPNTPFKPVTNVDLYFFFKDEKFYTREKLFTNYMIEENIPKLNWKITKDTASFSGIHCQKATTNFRGRTWTSWYAPELPFQSGPWKLNGLPGLIIEAYDSKKEVIFQLSEIDNLKNETENIYAKSFYFGTEVKADPDTKITTRAEFDKVMDLYKKDPKGFTAAATGTSVNSVFIGTSTRGVSHNVINSPIELPGK